MPLFKEMDPALAWKAIEGHENVLAPEAKVLDAFYRQFRCKRCGNAVRKEIDARHAFSDPETLNPRALLRCVTCNCLFDPHSGLVLEKGHDVPPEIPLIVPK
jgi:hypothetical protein